MRRGREREKKIWKKKRGKKREKKKEKEQNKNEKEKNKKKDEGGGRGKVMSPVCICDYLIAFCNTTGMIVFKIMNGLSKTNLSFFSQPHNMKSLTKMDWW